MAKSEAPPYPQVFRNTSGHRMVITAQGKQPYGQKRGPSPRERMLGAPDWLPLQPPKLPRFGADE